MLILQVQLYSHRSNHSIKSLTRSHDTSHCGSYRSDGLLLVAGSDDSTVRVYHGKKVLSHLKGHTRLLTLPLRFSSLIFTNRLLSRQEYSFAKYFIFIIEKYFSNLIVSNILNHNIKGG